MNRDFKGIWIPRDIWLIKGLKPQYRIFLAEIDSLDKGDGCWAGNGHFSRLFGLSESRCSEIINMLEKKGLIAIEMSKNADQTNHRKLRLCTPSENRNTPSENRNTPSENRNTPSENRNTPIYKEEKYNIEIQKRETRAYDFLKNNFPGRLEQEFLMRYKTQLRDFENFVDTFNDKVDIEELVFEPKVLFGRLRQLARNWVANKDRFNLNQGNEAKSLTGKRLDYAK